MKNKPNAILSIKDQLVDSSRLIIELVSNGIGDNPVLFREAMDTAFREKPPISSRASRVIQLCVEKNRELILPYMDAIIHNMPEDEGPRRSFLKILANLRFDFTEDQKGVLANSCFDWIQSADQSIAIKVYCMQILAEIAETEPDLKPELISVIEEQIPRGSAGIKAQGKKILKKLYSGKLL